MTEALHVKLSPIRRRQVVQKLLFWAVAGLLGGAIVGLALAACRYAFGWADGVWFAAVAVAAGPVAGSLIALLVLLPRPNWVAAARAVDSHYQLKDRTESALDFSAHTLSASKQQFTELQLADTLQHLDKVQPEAVVPLKAPRLLPGALAVTVAALVLALLPLKPAELAAAPAETPESILEQADEITESLEELEEELREEVDPELQELIKELKEKAAELKEPGVDVKEALAKISEMEAAIQSAQSQSSLEQVDQQLQEIGEAMASAKALEGAGQALAEGKYDKAAKELAELENVELERNEARNTAQKLRKASRNAGDGGNGSLGEAAEELAEGIEEGDNGKSLSGARKLGEKAGRQARRKKINDLLKAELATLNECKGNCQKNSTTKGKRKEKSTNPSTSFGMSESGNIDGESTSLKSEVNREQITGMADAGDSEFETSSTSEGRQEGQRGYREVYQKYKKISDAVLDSEQIPLGHRQTIRKYFESIRPENDSPARE